MAYFQCMNIGSEGASVLEDLTDISLNNLTNGQILKYNTTTQKWENSNESGEIPDVQLFETLTYTEVKISSVVSPFTITNNTLTSVSSSMSNSETNILSTGTFDLTDINIIEVVVDSATFYQGGNWNGFFYVCDDDTNVRNNTYPSVAHKIMFSNTSTPLKYSLDVSQLNGQWFIGVCTGGHTNLVVSAVAIGSGLTGHVIIDKNNVDMSQRSGLQFTGNVTVTDDSTNDKTVVNIQGTNNVQSDWNQNDNTADDYIKNKPTFATVATSGDYEDLINTPNIPTATSDLNNDSGFITSAALPTKVSDLTNDTGFITSTVNNLINYYKKNETYTQSEVDALISAIVTLNILVVQTLPTTDISTTTIYLVPKQTAGTQDVYDEYINTTGTTSGWEHIGTTEIDLSNYYTKTETDTLLNAKADTSDIPTVNDGTLTIQQNGETKGTFTANQSGNSTVNIKTPTADIQTATDEFTTINGGLLSSLKVSLSPNQDLHGYDSPWVGGAGKNKFDKNGNLENGKFIQANGTLTSSTNWNTTDYQQIIPDTYTMSGATEGAGGYYGICWYDSEKTYISGFQKFATAPQTVTIPNNAKYVRYSVNNSSLDSFMLEQGSTATDFAPYSNICPISGHTQVDVDVSDGDTTQEQVTVNLGGTYYSGTLDVVTGVFTPDTAEKILPSDGWLAEGENTGAYTNYSIKADSAYPELICSESVRAINYNDVFNNDHKIGLSTTRVIWHESTFADVTALMNYLSNNTVQIVHKLATPTPIQLSPTMVKALVGENHLSAPLDGQEITESEYRELFTWDEVEEIAQKLATSAVADLRCYQFEDGAYEILAYVDSGTVFYDWIAASPSVKMLSTISVMPPLDEIEFTDSSIFSNSICELVIVGDSDVPAVTHVKVTYGKVVFTLSEALSSTIQCACKVTNSILY